MRGHVSIGFFNFDVLFLQGKHNRFRCIISSALMRKVNFLNR